MPKHLKIEVGDIASIAYVSTNDPMHRNRHDIINRPGKVTKISEIRHPNLTPYKGMQPWYSVEIITDYNMIIICELCQLNLQKKHLDQTLTNEVIEIKRKNLLTRINNDLTYRLKKTEEIPF